MTRYVVEVRRRPSGCGTVFAWLILIGACIAFWQYALAIGLPIVIGLIVYGATRRRPRSVAASSSSPTRPAPNPSPRPAVFRRRRCEHCGAPGQGPVCRYCRTAID